MNHYITSEFERLIGASRLDSLNSHPSSVYGLDSMLNISYLNPAWFKFSAVNGNDIFDSSEWLLGKNILDSIPDVLKEFYKDLFESTLEKDKHPIISKQLEYECSSPTLYRRFSMHLYPIGSNGIVIVHSLVIEEPYTSPSVEGMLVFDEEEYIDEKGILTQCANCRRIENKKHPNRWDWIPKLIEEPYSMTSHGICKPCMQHYYLSNE